MFLFSCQCRCKFVDVFMDMYIGKYVFFSVVALFMYCVSKFDGDFVLVL